MSKQFPLSRRARRVRTHTCFAVAAAVAPFVSSASGVTKSWVGADGAIWGNTSSWSPAIVPVNGEDAIIGTNGVAGSSPIAIFTSIYTSSGLKSLTLNATAVNVYTLSQSLTTSAMIATTEVIGDNVNGNLYTQNGGSNTASTLTLGNVSGGVGTYNLSGPSTVMVNAFAFSVGSGGVGVVNQLGGTVNIGSGGFLFVGGSSSISTSTYTFTGGTLAVGNSAGIAITNRGNFYQNGGAVTFAGPDGIAVNSAAPAALTNIYQLSSGSITGQGFETVGSSGPSGSATFVQTGGANTFAASGTLTIAPGGRGNYNLSGGTIFGVNETIGSASGSVGTFTQSGGNNSLSNTGAFQMAKSAGSVGVYNMDNSVGTSVLTANEEDIGVSGSATFNQKAGTNNATRIFMGLNAGSSSVYNLSGGNLIVSNGNDDVSIGYSGTSALFNQTGGTFSVQGFGGSIFIANGAPGTYLLRGGNASVDLLYVGTVSDGTMTQTGGALTLTVSSQSNLQVGYLGTGTYTLSSDDGAASILAANETIGGASNGSFTQFSGTTNTITNFFQLGTNSVTGTYMMFGGVFTANTGYVGYGGGTGTFTQSGSSNVTFQTGGLTVGAGGGVGIYNLFGGTLTTPTANTGGTIIKPGSQFFQSGGTFNGYLINSGTFNYAGGTFAGTLENAVNGTVLLQTSLVATGGVLNKGTINLPIGINLGSGFGGIAQVDNENTINLSGGGFAGTAGVVNNGNIVGYGTIANSLGFTNNGAIIQTAGNLFFSTAETNYGSITLQEGRQLLLTQNSLTNSASLIMNGAVIGGAGTLNNSVGGTVYGPGTITAGFVQNTGTIEPGFGTLNISPSWINQGVVILTGPASSLTGGPINNSSGIQGAGSIGSPIINLGTIEAIGGTLALNSTITNPVGGTLAVSNGNKLFITAGLATNAGLISLVGGTFDNVSHTLNNTGQITGYGILRTGGLTNNGTFNLTGSNPAAGTTTVNGNVNNSAGKLINVEYNPAIFTGNVVNNGTIKSTGTTVTFTGTYSGNAYISDPSTNIFQNNVTINAGGSMTGGVGDVYRFLGGVVQNNGTFTNGGTLNSYVNFTNNFSFTQTGPQAWTVGTNFTNTGGTATFGSDAGAGGQNLNVADVTGTINFGVTQHLASLNVGLGSKVQVTAIGTPRAVVLTPVFFDNGTVDLGSNGLDVQGGGSSALATVTQLIQIGYSNGAWTGTGIDSSTAAADSKHLTAVGVILNTAGGNTPIYTTFDGATAAVNDVLAKYTYYGDANLDGKVDGSDYSRIDNGNLFHSSGWFNGDFNYDGSINGSDYTLIDNAYNSQGAAILSSVADPSATISAQVAGGPSVPEPGALMLIAVGAASQLRRRRRFAN